MEVMCSIDKNLPFSIKSSLSNYYNLITDAFLDRETQSEYNITVIATDSGSPALSSSTTLRLKISDINDNAPVFDRNSYSTHLLENNEPGLSICSVTARDLDWNQNSRVTYFLENTQIGGTPISSYVSINSENGVIHAVRSLIMSKLNSLVLL